MRAEDSIDGREREREREREEEREGRYLLLLFSQGQTKIASRPTYKSRICVEAIAK